MTRILLTATLAAGLLGFAPPAGHAGSGTGTRSGAATVTAPRTADQARIDAAAAAQANGIQRPDSRPRNTPQQNAPQQNTRQPDSSKPQRGLHSSRGMHPGPAVPPWATAQPFTITPSPAPGQLRMPWRNCVAVGRAYLLLRADLLEQFAAAQKELGYRYCRFHALFDRDMDVVERAKDGSLTFKWHQIDKIYDALLAMGIRPFVELNPMPDALASGTQQLFWYKANVTPPQDYREWELLVHEFAKHLVRRYGLDEVRKWYFEVWNEPNLSGFWSGTKNEYFKLYKASADGLKSVDGGLRIGGPASSKANWIQDMIDYCTDNGVPLDFISTHLYPQDEQVDYPDRTGSPYGVGEYFPAKIKSVKEIVANSKCPDLEIHWTEWNTQQAPSADKVTWGDNRYVDDLHAAATIVRNCVETDADAQTMAYWVLSDIFDEGSIPDAPFSCTYGLMTIHGIRKASYNAFALMRRMEGDLMQVASPEAIQPGKGITATEEGDIVRVLAWNQNFVELNKAVPFNAAITLPTLKDTAYIITRATIKEGDGSPWETWVAMGRPLNLTPVQQKLLEAASVPEYSLVQDYTAGPGGLSLNCCLAPGEVAFFEITPRASGYGRSRIDDAEFRIWDKAMGDRSK